jgi:hypothetical protein
VNTPPPVFATPCVLLGANVRRRLGHILINGIPKGIEF